MGLFDLFRGRKQEDKIIIDVNLEGMDDLINGKKGEFYSREKELLSTIKRDKDLLIADLQDKIKILEAIDLSQKKVDERTRLIVKENLFYFTSNLKKLIENLKSLENKELNGFITDLNKRFFDFEKKSLINYEKATFLIGKELGSVKESIAGFFKNLNSIISENKEFFENMKIIDYAEGKMKALNESKERKNEIDKNLKSVESEIEELKKENESFEKIIEKIKKSEEYKKEIDAEIIIDEKKKQYEKELLKLRESIDFKSLANIFHSNEKIMNKLKNYKNEFKETFETDSNALIDIIKDAGMETKLITDKVNKLEKERENIHKIDKKDTEIKKILNLQSNIRNNKSEIETLENNKSKESKLIEKFEETKQTIVDELRNELIKMDVRLAEE